jgi:phosphatidylinositol phospholipase C delta
MSGKMDPGSQSKKISHPITKPSIQTALTSVEVPSYLLDGVRVIKVASNGRMGDRILTLSENKFTLFVTVHKVVTDPTVGGSLLRATLQKVASIGSYDTNGDEKVDTERSIDIGSITRLYKGQMTLKFEVARKSLPGGKTLISSQLDPQKSLSIIFRGDRSLDIILESRERRDEILDALNRLMKAYQASKGKATTDVLLLRYVWLDVDKDQSQTVDLGEFSKVLERINYSVKPQLLKKNYQHFTRKILGLDRGKARRGLTFDQAVTFLHKLKRDGPDAWIHKPVNQIWESLFGQEGIVSAKEFLKKFLHDIQGETDATLEYVTHLFSQLNQLQIANVSSDETIATHPSKYIDKHRFEVYLSSDTNSIFEPSKEKHSQSTMSRPLPHYWINSSHNTYLTGDQLKSQSSVEMYMNALYRGCRCVEIDVWDGMEEGSLAPVVYHGHTITSKILFRDVIEAIQTFIQLNPDTYPIILSLENHCRRSCQQQMAEMLTRLLGRHLFIPTEAVLNSELPSPEKLRGMVLIKGRRPPSDQIDNYTYIDSSSDEDEAVVDSEQLLSSVPEQLKSSEKVFVQLAPDLARITLFHGTNFKTWGESIASPTYHIHSWSESQVSTILRKKESHHCVVYNKTHLSRVYPVGSRVGSTNYSPVLAWSMGCQLAALNFQTPDAPLRVNDGFFSQNGNCGYVLKSRELLDSHFHGEREDLSLTMTIRVLSGSCLPKPKGQKRGEIIDPYVSVAVYDVLDDEMKEVRKEHKTHFITDNGFSPIWNQEEFKFTVVNESVAMLLFTVWDKDVGAQDDFIASAAIPVCCIRRGYRCVKLLDANNTRSGPFGFASLLVKVDTEVIV